jgi:hypothetical protein
MSKYSQKWQYDQEDFSIYDGHSDENNTSVYEDEYFTNGGENNLNAIIYDSIETCRQNQKSEEEKLKALHQANKLDIQMTEEEYIQFIQNQAYFKHKYNYVNVLEEIHTYVIPMLNAKKSFYAEVNLMTSPNIAKLENKKLFYY